MGYLSKVLHVTRASRVAMRIGTLALTLVILAFLASAIPFRQIIDHRNRLEEAKENLAALEVENVLLADEVLALSTPAEIERMAREAGLCNAGRDRICRPVAGSERDRSGGGGCR